MSDLELDTLIGAFEGAGAESLLQWAGLESAGGSGGGSGRDKEVWKVVVCLLSHLSNI